MIVAYELAHPTMAASRLHSVMPLYHIHAISINLMASLLSGASCMASPGPQPEPFLLQWLRASSRPTWYSSVPTIHGMLCVGTSRLLFSAPDACLRPPLTLLLAMRALRLTFAESAGLGRNEIVHSLKFARSESSMLPMAVGEKLEQLLGVCISQTYAMTESSMMHGPQTGDSPRAAAARLAGSLA